MRGNSHLFHVPNASGERERYTLLLHFSDYIIPFSATFNITIQGSRQEYVTTHIESGVLQINELHFNNSQERTVKIDIEHKDPNALVLVELFSRNWVNPENLDGLKECLCDLHHNWPQTATILLTRCKTNGKSSSSTEYDNCWFCGNGLHTSSLLDKYNQKCIENKCGCANGSAENSGDGGCEIHESENCKYCNSGFHLIDSMTVPKTKVCIRNICSCAHGIAALGSESGCSVDGVEDCTSCYEGFHLFKSNGIKKCIPNICYCTNGSPNSNSCFADKTEDCSTCDVGFHLILHRTGRHICAQNTCICNHGSAVVGNSCIKDEREDCATCNTGYHTVGRSTVGLKCKENVCHCRHGKPISNGPMCSKHGVEDCDFCFSGYELVSSRNGQQQICEPRQPNSSSPCFEFGIDYKSRLSNVHWMKLSTPEECMFECLQLASCHYFTWVLNSIEALSKCFLKSNGDGRIENGEVYRGKFKFVSGSMNCFTNDQLSTTISNQVITTSSEDVLSTKKDDVTTLTKTISACLEPDIDSKSVDGIISWAKLPNVEECHRLCVITNDCRFFTWVRNYRIGKSACYLKRNDNGRVTAPRDVQISTDPTYISGTVEGLCRTL